MGDKLGYYEVLALIGAEEWLSHRLSARKQRQRRSARTFLGEKEARRD
jgi:hypothetical protein